MLKSWIIMLCLLHTQILRNNNDEIKRWLLHLRSSTPSSNLQVNILLYDKDIITPCTSKQLQFSRNLEWNANHVKARINNGINANLSVTKADNFAWIIRKLCHWPRATCAKSDIPRTRRLRKRYVNVSLDPLKITKFVFDYSFCYAITMADVNMA